MDDTFNLYFALIIAIGSVLMLAFGWIFWTNGTRKVSFLSSCGFIVGCVIIETFAETETAWLLCAGCILIMACGIAFDHSPLQIHYQKITGKDWKYKIYFDPDADKSNTNINDISGRKLMTKLLDVVGVDEDIKTVSLYKCPLSPKQWTMAFFYHNFIIFKTKAWFWSIEKDTIAIIIRRSKNEIDVKDKRIEQIDRLRNVVQMKSARGKTSVHKLINWLCDEHELYNKYHCPTANCKVFANAVFNKVAMSWCYVIKFSTEADLKYFDDSELMTKLVSLVGVDEVILNVFLYEDPTYYGSRWSCVFETNAWWWSIENRQEIMIITRNKEESNVEQYLNTDIKKRKSARGTTSVHDLINWLYNKKELKKLHIYIMLSTETFANDVFNYVSRMIGNQ